MPNQPDFEVSAAWDAEACVWVATSDQVPGLVTEAETLRILTEELRLLVPELLELNGKDVAGFRLKVAG